MIPDTIEAVATSVAVRTVTSMVDVRGEPADPHISYEFPVVRAALGGGGSK